MIQRSCVLAVNMGKRNDIPKGYKIPCYWDKKYTKTGRRVYVGPRKEHCFSVSEVFDAEIEGRKSHGDAYVPVDKNKDGNVEDYIQPPDFKKPDGWKEGKTDKGRKVYTSPQGFKCYSLFQVYVSWKKAEMAKGKGEVEEETLAEEKDSFDDFGYMSQKIVEIGQASNTLTIVYDERKKWIEQNWAQSSLLANEARGLELELECQN